MAKSDPRGPATDEGLTISAFAARTGVPQATLRTWELRYGAPRPLRLPGGHRRYSDRDVALVEQVLRLRAAGMNLETAVGQAMDAAGHVEPSVFKGLRRRRPELEPRVLRKRTLLAITRAVEDECCARASRPVLFASFQTPRFFQKSLPRWEDLARTARSTVVFAKFDHAQAALSNDAIIRVAVPADAPLIREWLLVCDSAEHAACVAGWELPGQRGIPDDERRFESLWTLDPVAVRDAARICARLASSFGHAPRPSITKLLGGSVTPASGDLVRADSLFNRVIAYADALGEPRRRL